MYVCMYVCMYVRIYIYIETPSPVARCLQRTLRIVEKEEAAGTLAWSILRSLWNFLNEYVEVGGGGGKRSFSLPEFLDFSH